MIKDEKTGKDNEEEKKKKGRWDRKEKKVNPEGNWMGPGKEVKLFGLWTLEYVACGMWSPNRAT